MRCGAWLFADGCPGVLRHPVCAGEGAESTGQDRYCAETVNPSLNPSKFHSTVRRVYLRASSMTCGIRAPESNRTG